MGNGSGPDVRHEGGVRPGIVRRVGRGTVTVLRYPWQLVIGAILGRFWGTTIPFPSRVPDLARFTRSAGFRDVHAAVEAWLDRHFAMIESGAPWLDRAGAVVTDYCWCNQDWPGGPLSARSRVMCVRGVAVSYGFDGSPRDRLPELAAAMLGAGWGADWPPRPPDGSAGPPVRALAGPGGWHYGNPHWVPVSGLPRPPGLHRMPGGSLPGALRPGMTVRGTSRGQPVVAMTPSLSVTQQQYSLHHLPRGSERVPTPCYVPLQVTGIDVDDGERAALARHERAVTVSISLQYYVNLDTGARPDRLRKRLLPVWNGLR